MKHFNKAKQKRNILEIEGNELMKRRDSCFGGRALQNSAQIADYQP